MPEENPLPPTSVSDWNISELYSRSFEIVKKNKVLWIFGTALAGTASFNGNFQGSGDFFNNFLKQTPEKESAPEKISQVLGAATSPSPLTDLFSQIFSQIPVYYYLILGLELFGFAVLVIVTSLITKAYLTSALINGVALAINNQNVSIATSSKPVFSTLTQLIKLQVIPGLIFGLVSFGVFLVLILGLIFGSTAVKIAFGFILFGALIAFSIALLLFTMTMIWAERKVILDKTAASEAFWQGFKIAKHKFWPSLLLGLVNNILAGFISFVLIILVIAGVTGGVMGTIFTYKDNPALAFSFVLIAVLVVVGAIIASALISGITTAFKASTWSLAYKSLQRKPEQV